MLRRTTSRDSRVVRRVLSGDRQAFGTLVDRYLPLAEAIAVSRVGNPTDAEDVVQDSFLKAFLSLDTLREPGRFRSWFASLVRNAATSFVRSRSRRSAREEAVGGAPTEPEVEQRDLHAAIRRLLDELDEPHREVLMLHYFAGLKVREVADTLNIGKAAAAKRLERARKALGDKVLHELGQALDEPENKRRRLHGRIMGAVAAASVSWKASAVTAATSALATAAWVKSTVAVLALVAVAFGGWWVMETPRQAQSNVGVGAASAQEQTVATAEPAATPARDPGDGGEADALASVGATESGSVSGRVYNETTGEGIEGAIVTAWGVDRPKTSYKSAPTGESGEYRIDGLGNAQYRLRTGPAELAYAMPATLEGAGDKRIQGRPGVLIEGIDFVFQEGHPFSGRVVDHTGRPVAGVSVSASNMAGMDRGVTVVSDENGRFSGAVMPPAVETVFRAKKDRQFHSFEYRPISVPPEGRHDFEIVVYPKGSVSGRLLTFDGKPKPDVMLLMRFEKRLPDALEKGPVETLRREEGGPETDAEGRFLIEPELPGDYAFVVGDYRPGASAEVVLGRCTVEPGKPISDITLTLPEGFVSHEETQRRGEEEPRPYAIAGRVTDRAGKPVEGARVRAEWQTQSPPFDVADAKSDARGRFSIPVLYDSLYSLRVTHPMLSDRLLRDVKGGSSNLHIVLDGLNRITGQVIAAETGAPVTRFGVSKRERHPVPKGGSPALSAEALNNLAAHIESTHTDPQGRFEITRVETGAYNIIVAAPGFAPAVAFVDVPAPEQGPVSVTVRLNPSAVITGVVLDAQGRPIPDAGVVARMDDDSARRDVYGRGHVRTDTDGRFSLSGFAPSAMVVAAGHPSFSTETIPVDASATTGPLRFTLKSWGRIEGIVTADGEPLTERDICADCGDHRYVSGKTDRDGFYTMDKVPPGTLTVRAGIQRPSRVQHIRRVVEVKPGKTTRVDMDIPPANGAVIGRVTIDGEPANGLYEWAIETPSGQDHDHDRFLAETVERRAGALAPGQFRVPDLPAGHVTLTVRAGKTLLKADLDFEKTVEFDLRDGEIRKIDIAF